MSESLNETHIQNIVQKRLQDKEYMSNLIADMLDAEDLRITIMNVLEKIDVIKDGYLRDIVKEDLETGRHYGR